MQAVGAIILGHGCGHAFLARAQRINGTLEDLVVGEGGANIYLPCRVPNNELLVSLASTDTVVYQMLDYQQVQSECTVLTVLLVSPCLKIYSTYGTV
jgi:hypothetical protein